MSIRKHFGMKPTGNLVIVGEPVESNILDVNGKPYYSCKLLVPVTARCSYDKEIEATEVDEVFMRAEDIDSEELVQEFINPEKPEEGWFVKGFIHDFIKSHEIVVYQATTVAKWAKDNRAGRKETQNSDINKRIRERMEARGKKS